jgi:hypothetical protein
LELEVSPKSNFLSLFQKKKNPPFHFEKEAFTNEIIVCIGYRLAQMELALVAALLKRVSKCEGVKYHDRKGYGARG